MDGQAPIDANCFNEANYNLELVNKQFPTIRYICMTTIIIVTILQFFIFKWRWLLNAVCYLECSWYLMISIIPTYETASLIWTPWNLCGYMFFGFIAYYTGKSAQIIFLNIVLFILLVVKLGWVHDLSLSMLNYMTYALYAIGFFALEFMLAMLLFYIAELTKKLQVANF